MKIAIITPVGPSHEETYNTLCKPSIERAIDQSVGHFSEAICLPVWDLDAELGRSRARNMGIATAREMGCEWIFFVDADDLLNVNAFQEVGPYLDHYDAIWGQICETSVQNFGTATVRQGQKVKIEGYADLLATDPFHALQMGHFVRMSVAAEVGFDEELNAGEDYRYYYQVWKHFECVKTNHVFFLNVRGNHSTGIKSATSDDWMHAVMRERLHAVFALKQEARLTSKATYPASDTSSDADEIHAEFCIFAPHTEIGSAGSRMMRELHEDICELGYRSTIFYVGQDPELKMAFSVDKIAWCFLTEQNIEHVLPPRDNLIVIHGENLSHEIFSSYNVVRYYLNKLGSTRNTGTARDGEFKLVWQEDFCADWDAKLSKVLTKGLNYFDNRDYLPSYSRSLDLTYVGKAQNHNDGLKQRDETLLLSKDWPPDQEQYLYLLSRTRYIFSYDPLTSVLADAIAMGAIPVILDSGKEEYDAHAIDEYISKSLYFRFGSHSGEGVFEAFEQSRKQWISGLRSKEEYMEVLQGTVRRIVDRFLSSGG